MKLPAESKTWIRPSTHEDVAEVIDGNAIRLPELPVPTAQRAPLADEGAGGVEDHDAAIGHVLNTGEVGDVYVARVIDRDVDRSRDTPLADEIAIGIEHLDGFRKRAGDEDVPRRIDRNAPGRPQRLVAGVRERADEGAGGVENLDAIVQGVGDVDVARVVDGYAPWE